eukprot:gene26969-33164_t
MNYVSGYGASDELGQTEDLYDEYDLDTHVQEVDVCFLMAAARINNRKIAKTLVASAYPEGQKLTEVILAASEQNHLRFVDDLLKDPRSPYPDLVDVLTMKGDVEGVGILKSRPMVNAEDFEQLARLRKTHKEAVIAWMSRMKAPMECEPS